MWLIAVWILCLSVLRQYLNLQPFAFERACNSKRSDVLSEVWLKLDLYTVAPQIYKCWFLIGTKSVLGLFIVESVLCSCVCIDDVDTCRSQSTFTERIWIMLLPLCLSTVWTSVYPWRTPVLANCNPQEGYTVHMDSPRGLHFCIHTSKGEGGGKLDAVIYKRQHQFLFRNIKCEQYVWTIYDQYFTSSICLFHVEVTVIYFIYLFCFMFCSCLLL